MAKMTFKLPEETIRKMEALGSHYDAVTSAVLEEGVKPLYAAAKQSLSSVIGQGTKEPSESTGDLLESLSVTKPYQSADGNWNIKVGCIGYDRKGVPNPLKAAVLEHGRSNQPAKPWAKPAGIDSPGTPARFAAMVDFPSPEMPLVISTVWLSFPTRV